MKTTFYIVQSKVFGVRNIVRRDEADTFTAWTFTNGEVVPPTAFNKNWDIVAEIDVDKATLNFTKEFGGK